MTWKILLFICVILPAACVPRTAVNPVVSCIPEEGFYWGGYYPGDAGKDSWYFDFYEYIPYTDNGGCIYQGAYSDPYIGDEWFFDEYDISE